MNQQSILQKYKYKNENENNTMDIVREKQVWLNLERLSVESVSSSSGCKWAIMDNYETVNGIIIHAIWLLISAIR